MATEKTFKGSNNNIRLPILGELKAGDLFRFPNETSLKIWTIDQNYVDIENGNIEYEINLES